MFTKKLVEEYKRWRETRFFKKHGVSSWKGYYLKYDPDYDARADTIRQMFFGYPYIAEITQASSLKAPEGWHHDGLQYLNSWLEISCKGKTRATIQRTMPTSYHYEDGSVKHDWHLNEFCRDALYVAFQDERDYIMFLLKWETG